MTPIERAEKEIKEQGGIWEEEGWAVKKDLNLWNFDLTVLPKIKSVGGYFDCSSNKLTNLTGSPKMVGKDFYCSCNNLTNLTSSPKSVGGNFWCERNPFKSLFGLPDKIGGKFYCDVGLSFPKEEIIFLIKAHPRNLKEIVKWIKWI